MLKTQKDAGDPGALERLMIRTLGAFGLLFSFTGCSPLIEDSDGITYSVDGQKNATAKTLDSGASIEDCLALSFADTGSDTGFYTTSAWCPDADEDGYFAADPSDPFQTGCICLVAGSLSSEFVEVFETSANGEDCDDADDIVTSASITAYADTDSDSYGDPSTSMLVCGTGDGWVSDNTDCDDSNGAINPGATEVCDSADNDCDTAVDEDVGVSTWYADGDDDGYGEADDTVTDCSQPDGYVANDDDCDDNDDNVNPDGTETCNGQDDNCDGMYDAEDDDVVDAMFFYEDDDVDGYGDPDSSVIACDQPEGYVDNDDDCDDWDGDINPVAVEVCDDVDNDCDSSTDEGATDAITWYADADSDSFGDADASVEACDQPGGYTADNDDCDDGNGDINPDATEVCDSADNDCDSSTDEDVCDTGDTGGDDTGDTGDTGDSGDTGGDDTGGDDTGGDDTGGDTGDSGDETEVCVTANTTAYPFKLMLSDMTAYPWTPDDPMWETGYGTGTGTVCGTFELISGNTLKIQGGFDQDGDGLYGEESSDYWLWMLTMVNASTVTIAGVDVTSSVSNMSWGGGSDGIVVIP